MFLVVRADGKFWDGVGWSVKGRPFCSIGMATRSLHEEGEPATLPVEIVESKPQGTLEFTKLQENT